MTGAARFLRGGDESLWLPLLTPATLGLQDTLQFETWRTQLRFAALTGLLELVHVPGGAEGGPMVVAASRPAQAHRALLFGLGTPCAVSMRAAVARLQEGTQLHTVSQEAGDLWLDSALEAGFTAVGHQVFVNHLARIRDLESPAPPCAGLVPWDDALVEAVAELAAWGNAGTVSGLALCQPELPTRAAVVAHVHRIAGPEGPLMREASFVKLEAGVPVGAVLVTRGEHGPMLYELVVAAVARERGLGRLLVRAAQRALRAAGYTEMRFHTTDVNAPVHRLYAPGEAELVTSWRAGWWMAPELMAEARSVG